MIFLPQAVSAISYELSGGVFGHVSFVPNQTIAGVITFFDLPSHSDAEAVLRSHHEMEISIADWTFDPLQDLMALMVRQPIGFVILPLCFH
jgi:hypothetical protein